MLFITKFHCNLTQHEWFQFMNHWKSFYVQFYLLQILLLAELSFFLILGITLIQAAVLYIIQRGGIIIEPLNISILSLVFPVYKLPSSKVEICTGVNFFNVNRSNFLYQCHFGSFYYIHVTREKLVKQHLYKKFVCKID